MSYSLIKPNFLSFRLKQQFRLLIAALFIPLVLLACSQEKATLRDNNEPALLLWAGIAEELKALDEGWMDHLETEGKSFRGEFDAVFIRHQVTRKDFVALSVDVFVGVMYFGAYTHDMIAEEKLTWTSQIMVENKLGIRDKLSELGFPMYQGN